MYLRQNEELLHNILNFSEHEQVDFVRNLMQQMSHYQLGQIDLTLQVWENKNKKRTLEIFNVLYPT